MRMIERYRSVPASVSGRTKHDVILSAARAVLDLQGATESRWRIPKLATRDTTTQLIVIERQIVAHDQDVVAFTLAAPDRSRLPGWHPGAHIDVQLPSGRVRQYSLCGDPRDRHVYRIAVRRIPDGGGGSTEIHRSLTVGASVTTSGPRNAFPLALPGHGSPARRLRFIAGGIGITPILSMIQRAEELGVDWSMVYSGRSLDSLPFLDELSRFGSRVEIRTDDAHGTPCAADLLGDCPDGTAVYACGPAPMLDAVRAELIDRHGVELHFERFAPPPVVDGRPFSVALAKTGGSVTVKSDQTLLSALREAGVTPTYSCQQGFCGTCRTRVLAGAVEHRDTLLTDSERDAGTMLICVSRAPEGKHLTLDL